MTQKEITISGKTYPVVFTIKTMMGFEDITGKPFFGETFKSIGDKTALVFASIIAADDQAKITLDELLNADKMEVLTDIVAAFTTIDTLAQEFFKTPAVEPEPENTETQGDTGKN